jgi:flavin reductase (DIM6/NTAB) family NADH-FMN oxidoreductase RutF
VAISLRKATYSYGNILAQKAFTVNIPPEKYVREADYFGIATGEKEDKFAATGLTPVKSDVVNAPYVAEFPLVLECRLLHSFEFGLHTQFVGEILDVKADESVLGEDGLPDIEKIRPVVYAPLIRKYYGIGACLGKSFSLGKELDRK